MRNSYVQAQHLADSITYNSIIVPDKGRYTRLDLDQILYVRSDKNYCRIYAMSKEKYFLVRCSMTEFLKKMNNIYLSEIKDDNNQPDSNDKETIEEKMQPIFCRIHDQYIIPLNQIEYPTEDLTTVVLKCKEELPIGRTYLHAFKKAARLFS